MEKILIIYLTVFSLFSYSQNKENKNSTAKYLTFSEIKNSKIIKETYMLLNKTIIVKDGFNIDVNLKIDFMCKIERISENQIIRLNSLIDDALLRTKNITSTRDYSFQPKEINLSNINLENLWIANIKYSVQNENKEIINENAYIKYDKEFNRIKNIYE